MGDYNAIVGEALDRTVQRAFERGRESGLAEAQERITALERQNARLREALTSIHYFAETVLDGRGHLSEGEALAECQIEARTALELAHSQEG